MSDNIVPMNGLFDAEYFDMKSQHVDDTFRIFVAKPSVVSDNAEYPVIFALDGNAAFASLAGTQRMLTQGGEVPASYVVGIGYPGDSLMHSMVNRNRDYAPTEPGENEAMTLGGKFPAGGPAFFRFIQQELKPLIAGRYAVKLSEATLQGISLGGLFATWVLLTEPAAFKHYIIGSPALWWRDQQVWAWEEQFATDNKDIDATVFISAGDMELAEHVRADAVAIAEKNPAMREHIERVIAWNDEKGWPELAKLAPRLASQLEQRSYPHLKVLCHNMPHENHMSAPPAITSRGLRFVNGSWSPG